MTASRNKASRAVTAALVGVLSVGAVPMVAVAAESGATPLIAVGEDQVSQATVATATDQDGQGVYLGQEIKFSYDGEAHYVVPTVIYNASVTQGDGYLDVKEKGFKVTYYKEVGDVDPGMTVGSVKLANGAYAAVVNRESINGTGTYYVVVSSTFENAAQSGCILKFEIVDTSWDDAYVCDGTDVSDTVIEYDGTNQTFGNSDISLVVNGERLVANTDYKDQKVYEKGAVSDDANTYAKEVGDYVVRVTAGGVYHYVDFTISPLDISTSEIEFDTPTYAVNGSTWPTMITKIGDAEINEWNAGTGTGKVGDDDVTVSLKLRDDTAPEDGVGARVYVVSTTDTTGNVVNSQEVTVVRYKDEVTFTYNRQPVANDDETGYYDLGAVTLDPSAVQATNADGDKFDVSVTYTRADGTVIGDEQPTTPGTYFAVFTALDDTYAFGGQLRVKFVVNATLVRVSDIYAYYKGSTLQEAEVEDIYDGTDLVQNLTVSATDEDGEAVPEGELELVVTDSDGNVVEGAVEAGTYTVTVKAVDGSGYLVEGDADTIELTVYPVTVDDNQDSNARLRLVGTMGYGDDADTAYLYTGSAVTPSFEYDLTAGMWGYDKSVDWVGLPTDAYNVRYQKAVGFDENGNPTNWENVDECVEPGTYRAVLSDAKSDSYVVNTRVKFTITDQKVYADVPNDAWYAEVVYEANDMGYMTGYADGTFFGPTDSLSRADAVVVLWKMAGEPVATPSEGSSGNLVYDTPYGDTDDSAYYAQALQWATKLGIVAGDGDAQESFRPSASVKREEFAKMLYVYEQLQGNVEGDVDEDEILSTFSDADSVSEWAGEYVAWLVDQGVMGVDTETINGDGTIVRAEVAAMVVRIQPGGQLDDFMTSK